MRRALDRVEGRVLPRARARRRRRRGDGAARRARAPAAARERGPQRIVYLGGIVHGDELSPHLASREVGEILRASGVPTIERRTLVERVPPIVGPNRRLSRGGADRVRYRDIVDEVADRLGRPRVARTVPAPRLLATPTQSLRLVDSLRFDTDVRDEAAARDFHVRPVGPSEAVEAALA